MLPGPGRVVVENVRLATEEELINNNAVRRELQPLLFEEQLTHVRARRTTTSGAEATSELAFTPPQARTTPRPRTTGPPLRRPRTKRGA